MTDLAVQLPEANRRLDAIDRKILTVLQEDASLSVAEIGDRVGLSSTPCWKRIQRLQACGVGSIPRITPLSSPAKAGDPVFQRHLFSTDKPRRTGSPAFAGDDTSGRRRMRHHSQIF